MSSTSLNKNRKSNSRSRDRDPKSSGQRKFKHQQIQITKIQKADKVRAEDELPAKLDRFSSEGQEELVQSYQLPAFYGSNENKSGFQAMHSQHLAQKRNYTSYGGPRASAAHEIAARNYEYMQQSLNF